MIRQIDKIIIHCSATIEGMDFDAADIKQWHLARGFSDIGYHYVILIDGSVEHGRPIERKGAHCKGYNENSIGICYIGGLDKKKRPKDTRSYNQKTSLDRLLQELKADYPTATIHGHKEYADKACPCFDVSKEYGL
jgi:N-acetylmuramoyl-L-alanine amidase